MPKPISKSVPNPMYRTPARLRGISFMICYTLSGSEDEAHLLWWIDSEAGEDGEGPITTMFDTLTPIEMAMLEAQARADAEFG
jgi:hypothetical protein